MPTHEHIFVPAPVEIGGDQSVGASDQIHLGRWFVSFRRHALPQSSVSDNEISVQSEEFFKRHFVEFGSSLRLNPGQIIFAVTLQWLQLRPQTTVVLSPNTFPGPTGLQVTLLNPAFHTYTGCLTLELFNSSTTAIELKPGQFVGHLYCTSSPECDVDGQPAVDRGTGICNNRRRPQLDPAYCRQLMQNDFRKL
jgi:deoxycytidine triphosphate deaminase